MVLWSTFFAFKVLSAQTYRFKCHKNRAISNIIYLYWPIKNTPDRFLIEVNPTNVGFNATKQWKSRIWNPLVGVIRNGYDNFDSRHVDYYPCIITTIILFFPNVLNSDEHYIATLIFYYLHWINESFFSGNFLPFRRIILMSVLLIEERNF